MWQTVFKSVACFSIIGFVDIVRGSVVELLPEVTFNVNSRTVSFARLSAPEQDVSSKHQGCAAGR